MANCEKKPVITFDCADDVRIKKQGITTFGIGLKSGDDAKVSVATAGVKATCYNCEGIDYTGKPFRKAVFLRGGATTIFWFSVFEPGRLEIIVSDTDGNPLAEHAIDVTESDEVETDPFADVASPNKLVWLNSSLGLDDSVVAPFTPATVRNGKIGILGREIKLTNGLPSEIQTLFDDEVKISGVKSDVIASPIVFSVSGEEFSYGIPIVTTRGGCVYSVVKGASDNFDIEINSSVEFDGYCEFSVRLKCVRDVKVDDITLSLPMSKDKTKYFCGLGRQGGRFDGKTDWKWNVDKYQDAFWVGDVCGGIRLRLKGANYRKPLVNIYYDYRKLELPDGWGNSGKGGVKYKNDAFVAYTGDRMFRKGETVGFDFDIVVTPVKETDIGKQFDTRIFHRMFDSDSWLAAAEKEGANVINVHHGNDLCPYINYPFTEIAALKEFTDKAHAKGMKVKVYYTMREISINAAEFKAFRDLDGEIITEKQCDVDIAPWQKETAEYIGKTVGEDVVGAWRQPLKGKKYKGIYDTAVITEGQSRLCNFYAEGLNYLIEKTGIDGIYIDDTAFDRITARRIRRILDKKSGSLIDFHQWNHFLRRGGNTPAMYAEIYPYVDKCWTGEGFDVDGSPEYWLTEISGLPFGLTADMMDSGNRYRGLTFGMTSRAGWETNEDTPSDVYALIDRFGLADAEVVGWWDERSRADCSDERVRVTEFIVGGKSYFAVANFSDEPIETVITIDGKSDLTFVAPEHKGFQRGATLENPINTEGGKGWFLTLAAGKHQCG